LEQALEALRTATEDEDELIGSIRLTVPETVTEHVLAPVLPRFLAAHPRISIEINVDARNVDLVREGFDAGVRSAGIPKDMVRVRIGKPFRIVVVASPSYLARFGEPLRPEELAQHRCVAMVTGACAWDLTRGRRKWSIPVTPAAVCNDRGGRISFAEAGVGLTRVTDLDAAEALQRGTLRLVLEDYAPRIAGAFLYYPSRRQASPALRALAEMLTRKEARA
jgi:DNA-binding transcriptional LysR family regulator